jgi:hypothetical protein
MYGQAQTLESRDRSNICKCVCVVVSYPFVVADGNLNIVVVVYADCDIGDIPEEHDEIWFSLGLLSRRGISSLGFELAAVKVNRDPVPLDLLHKVIGRAN